MRLPLFLSTLAAFAVAASAAEPTAPSSFPVTITVDASQVRGPMQPMWRFFGADEPNYATMKDGRVLLGELGELRPDQVYFRAHNLLCTGDGTPALKWGSTNAYTQGADGSPVYSWTVLDHIFDTYRANHVRPYVELGFMPEALSTHPQPYQHAWRPGSSFESLGTGWAYPPTDYAKWGELAYRWAKHCAERYGAEEVAQWWWEVWNEANLKPYFHGTPEEFYRLHDFAIAGVRRAIPNARVGGPDMAGSDPVFMRAFFEHCLRGVNDATGEKGTPLDFVSFHAKGQPSFVEGHVRLGIAAQLTDIDRGFATIATFPELKSKPIVIGESDPDGCAACQGPQLGYRTTTMYSSYTAASFARKYLLADKHGVNLAGALTWAFEFEDQPFFAGQRVLANNGIDLPVLNVFRLFSRMGGDRVASTSSSEVSLADIVARGVRGTPDVAALATIEPHRTCILSWHYHDDDVRGPAAAVRVALQHLPIDHANARVTEYRIDETHSNAFTVWKQIGAPTAPNPKQYEQLVAAGKLAKMTNAPANVDIRRGAAEVSLTLPRQAVDLLIIEWD